MSEPTESTVPLPRVNPELVGHEDAERAFLKAFGSGRLAHAWLICGPKGIGKATLAYRIARHALARTEGGAGDAGGLFGDSLPEPAAGSLFMEPDHPVFRRVAVESHSGLLVVERRMDPERKRMRTEIVVDDARGIASFFAMTPGEGAWRVVIIDSVDEMNRNAVNAVLKVLEEPPPRSLLLLVSHNPGGLLPTVRSRCRRLVLRPLSQDAAEGLIRRHRPEIPEADARLLARLCEGSPGRALALAEEGGLDLFRDVDSLLAGLPRLDIAKTHAFAERAGRSGAEASFGAACDLIRWWIGRAVRIAAGAEEAESDPLRRIAQAGGLDRWLEVWEKTTRLLARTDRVNLDRKQVLLNVFLAIERAARG